MQTNWLPLPMLLALLGPAVAQATEEQTRSLLEKIDRAFNARDLEALLGHFRFTHETLGDQLRARMQAVMDFDARLHRDSEILSFYKRHGRAIALVRCTTHCVDNPCLRHSEHCYLAVGPDLKAEFMVTVNDRALGHVTRKDQRFTCPACNYAFGGSSRWLAVPAWPDQTGCMESLTFIALGHDLVAEVSVHVLEEVQAAEEAMKRLLEEMRDLPWLDAARASRVVPWLPPAHARNKPRHLDGARCRVPLRDGGTAAIHLATFGPIRYLMVVQGKEALLESQQPLIRELLQGFELLETGKAPADIGQLSLRIHTGGGRIEENTYVNTVQDLELTAPAGWKGTVYASRHLFRVRFGCPAGAGSLVLEGMSPPVGFTRWTEDMADRLFRYACANRDLEEANGTRWKRGADGFRWREARSGPGKGKPARIVRLALGGEVLVLMAGEAGDPATLKAVRKAMASLAAR